MEKSKKLKVIKSAVKTAEAKAIGDKLWINWKDVDLKQFTQWVNVEREHWSRGSLETNITKDDPIKTGKIAWIHLKELKNYYTWLEKMEKEWKKSDKYKI